jgi:hypothetical protein
MNEPTQVIDIGDSVLCDWCSREYRGSDASGGFMYGTYATCPACAEHKEAAAAKYGEQRFIGARCPPGMTFHAWVMQLRGGDNTIKVFGKAKP